MPSFFRLRPIESDRPKLHILVASFKIHEIST